MSEETENLYAAGAITFRELISGVSDATINAYRAGYNAGKYSEIPEYEDEIESLKADLANVEYDLMREQERNDDLRTKHRKIAEIMKRLDDWHTGKSVSDPLNDIIKDFTEAMK